MSKSNDPRLANPLDHYRSYSYHFILSIANTTSAFEKMLGQNGTHQLQTVQGVELGGQLNIPNEKAFLLVDTRRFSQFSITDVTTEHMYGTGSRVNPTVPVATLSMRLIDTTGLSFFNFLMDIMRNKLKTARASAFFMLTTIFIGHKDDGTTETIVASNTTLSLLTLDFEFGSSGSTYNIEFLEMEGAPQRGAGMEHVNSLGDITTISTEKGANNLGGLIQALENSLNVKSLEAYQKYSVANSKRQQQSTGDARTPKNGKLVQYMITLPKGWESFEINAASRSVNLEQIFLAKKPKKSTDPVRKEASQSEVAAAAQSSSKQFSYTMGITDAIKAILETSKQVLDLAKVKNGSAKIYKIVTSITSDAATYVIHFDVFEHDVPAVDNGKVVTAGGTSGGQFADASIIEYDYIFTGKNTDIKDLKIAYMPGTEMALDTNFNMGQTRLAVNSGAGQVKQNLDAVKKGTEESFEFNPNIRPGDPIFFANKSLTERAGAPEQQEAAKHADALAFLKAKQDYTQTMAFMHYISSMELTMVIRGNPGLFMKYADRGQRGGVAPHPQIISVEQADSFSAEQQNTAEVNFESTVKSAVASAKALYISSYINRKVAQKDAATCPLFVKINIRAPNVNAMGIQQGDNMFTDSFFFKGTYMVLTFKTTFSNGEFSQELILVPFDISGAYSETGSKDAIPVPGRPRGGA